MVSALNVANNILERGFSDGIDITPMKLQKLTYLVYKKYYQDTDRILFSENFEVWKYGPVIRSIYDEFKDYKGNAIKTYCEEADGSILIVNEKTSSSFKKALDTIWGKYKSYDGIPLSAMTHREGSAWYKAAKRNDVYLSDADIKAEEAFV
ncbi:type II toxin-antitoxin system antitoxin SocA domain-containing protein [Lachnospiraceae bacterium 56-18]|uniref:Panacea domain-containing protein n=1 Tax=Sporofaciens sp. JLR.KK001 TaxID=3112621 RepID=UPI002FF0A411